MSDRHILPSHYAIAPSTESKLFELFTLSMAETQKISQLTPAQEDQLIDYRKKWRNLTFSTDVSPESAIQISVDKAYNYLNLPTPKIYVVESLFDIPDSFWASSHWQDPGNVVSLHDKLLQPLIATFTSQVAGKLWGKLWDIAPPLHYLDGYTPLYPKGWGQTVGGKMQIDAFFKSPYGFRHCGRIDFCQGALDCTLDVDAWEALYGLIQLGGWLFLHEHLCIAVQKRLINSVGTPFGTENKTLVDSLTQPSSQVFASLQLAALESSAGRPKLAYERWLKTISIAQDQLSEMTRDRVFLAIVQQAKPITTYIDKGEYPFRDASSPFTSDVWDRCQQIVQLIETPELQTQAQSMLPAP